METDEAVQYHVLLNARGSMLVCYRDEAANHYLPKAVGVFFLMCYALFAQL